MNIIGINGSLRSGSLNRMLLKSASEVLTAKGAHVDDFDIGRVPLYNGDLDTDDPPAAVTELKEALSAADGLLLVTPEYNYGVPGVLKNALDWASRPAFKSPLAGKPTALLSASMSMIGGARAQAQLRNVLFGTLTPVYPAPEFLLMTAHEAFDENGDLVSEKTRSVLGRYLSGYLAWASGEGS